MEIPNSLKKSNHPLDVFSRPVPCILVHAKEIRGGVQFVTWPFLCFILHTVKHIPRGISMGCLTVKMKARFSHLPKKYDI